MAFKKGESGNPTGRRRQSEEEKNLKVEFIKQLKHYAPEALETLFNIMQDTKSKDRLKAAIYIIDKCFGSNFVAIDNDKTINDNNLVVRIVRVGKKEDEEDWETD